MPVLQIEMEEISMMNVSDDVLEATVVESAGAQSMANTLCNTCSYSDDCSTGS